MTQQNNLEGIGATDAKKYCDLIKEITNANARIYFAYPILVNLEVAMIEAYTKQAQEYPEFSYSNKIFAGIMGIITAGTLVNLVLEMIDKQYAKAQIKQMQEKAKKDTSF